MKNKNIYLWILLIVALAVTYIPKIIGEKMFLPDTDKIKSIAMEDTVAREIQSKKIIEDKIAIEEVIDKLSNSKKSVKTTSHDQPLESNYLSLTLNYEDKSTRVYLYESSGRYYFEIPYTGIYKTDKEIIDKIYKIFENQ